MWGAGTINTVHELARTVFFTRGIQLEAIGIPARRALNMREERLDKKVVTLKVNPQVLSHLHKKMRDCAVEVKVIEPSDLRSHIPAENDALDTKNPVCAKSDTHVHRNGLDQVANLIKIVRLSPILRRGDLRLVEQDNKSCGYLMLCVHRDIRIGGAQEGSDAPVDVIEVDVKPQVTL